MNGAYDPREQTINRFNAWYGEPELEQLTFFANAGYDLANGARLYGWAGYQNRDARSAGFFRPARDARNVIEIYPDGFLPIIAPDVTDYSVAGGVEWDWGDWQMDTSLVYGYNEMMFTIENTLNRSLGVDSPTRFDAGGFDYDQLVFNFPGVREIAVGGFHSPLNIAAGIEARLENYSITAGEPDSWRNGGVLLNGAPTASGALRADDYSDFGSNLSGKLAGRYDFTDSFALRGSVRNGFRAPSLQQHFFATTSTNFINGVPYGITTFPATDPVAEALGAQPLDAETSVNFSLGAENVFDEYPRRVPDQPQHDGQHAVLELLAVRPLGPLHLRQGLDRLLPRVSRAPLPPGRKALSAPRVAHGACRPQAPPPTARGSCS